MEGQFFFTTVAGLALSIAGFASLIAWLRDDPDTWDPVNLWRVKAIIREALTLVFLALVLIPIFTITNDIRMTIRLGSVGFMLSIVYEVVRNRAPDPTIWTPRITWVIYMVGSLIYFCAHVVNLWLANLGLLQFMALLAWLSPAGIFSNFVREMGGGSTRSSEASVD